MTSITAWTEPAPYPRSVASKQRVLIIGGGISGLAVAYRLRQLAPDAIECRLIEQEPRAGGKITSVREDEFLAEGGPDSFLASKAGILELCDELGLTDALIASHRSSGDAVIWSRGRLRTMPEAMQLVPTRVAPFLHSSLISWRGKLRMALEAIIPKREDGEDESVAGFVRRRLGDEAARKLADPLMAGIHAADPERLSLKSTFPAFERLEQQHGSITRAMWGRKATSNLGEKRHKAGLVTFRNGMQQLVEGLVAAVGRETMLLGAPVSRVTKKTSGYSVYLSGGRILPADVVVFATPAYITAKLVEDVDRKLASRLRGIRYASTVTVSLGFRRCDLPRGSGGTGYLVPQGERAGVLGCTWSSTKFDGRAAQDAALLRLYLGGARAAFMANKSQEELIQIARNELSLTYGIKATPVMTRVFRWIEGHPQYEVGHQERVEEIETLAAQHTGLHLAGAAFHGIGVPDCVQNGNEVARRILAELPDQRRAEARLKEAVI